MSLCCVVGDRLTVQWGLQCGWWTLVFCSLSFSRLTGVTQITSHNSIVIMTTRLPVLCHEWKYMWYECCICCVCIITHEATEILTTILTPVPDNVTIMSDQTGPSLAGQGLSYAMYPRSSWHLYPLVRTLHNRFQSLGEIFTFSPGC